MLERGLADLARPSDTTKNQATKSHLDNYSGILWYTRVLVRVLGVCTRRGPCARRYAEGADEGVGLNVVHDYGLDR